MPSALDILHHDTLTQVVNLFKFPQLILQNLLFPPRNIQGDTAKWDQLDPKREVGQFVPHGAPSHRVALEPIKQQIARCLKFYENKALSGDFLNILREPGTEQFNARAEITREQESLARRNARLKEWAISQALRGTLTVAQDDVRVSVDYSFDSDHEASVSATWATTTTDIPSDINTWKRLIAQDSGYTPGIVLTSSKTREYLLSNDNVKDLMGEGTVKEQMGLEGDIGRFMGLTWIFYDAGYKTTAGTFTRYLPDDDLFIVPVKDEIAEVCEMQVGTVPVPSMEGKDVTMVQGQASYADVVKDPVGLTIWLCENWLPCILVPDAFVFVDDLTP